MPMDQPPPPGRMGEFFKRSVKSIAKEVLKLRHEKRLWDAERQLRIDECAHLKNMLTQRRLDAGELDDLKKENAKITLRCARLSTEVVRLRLDIAALSHRSGHTADWSHLPHEILLNVFEETWPIEYRCDPSVAWGPRQPWLKTIRTAKSLALVCKAWYGPATELLYANIVFTRAGQVAALARTFREEPPFGNLSRLVRGIHLHGCIVLPRFSEVVREDLLLVLRSCTRLLSFSSREATSLSGYSEDPNYRFLDQVKSDMGPFPLKLTPSLWGTPTGEFHLAPAEVCFKQVFPLLSSLVRITSLVIGPFSWTKWDTETLPSVAFPSLECLQIAPTSSALETYVLQWSLPVLSALTVVGCRRFDIDATQWLQKHGARLKYLSWHLEEPMSMEEARDFLSQLAASCPEIEHLVFPTWFSDWQDDIPPLHVQSSTLRHIDILALPKWKSPLLAKVELAQDAKVPLLSSFRIVAPQAAFYTHACHPSLIPEDQPDMRIVHSFLRVCVVQTGRFVLYDPPDLALRMFTEREDEDDLQDSTYEPSEREDVETSDDDVSSAAGDSDRDGIFQDEGEGYYDPSNEEVRRHILKMYHRSQSRPIPVPYDPSEDSEEDSEDVADGEQDE